MKLWSIALSLALAAAGAQTPAPPAQGSASSGASEQIYTNADLHVTFWYPASLKPRDAQSVAQLGRRMMFGSDPEFDSTQVQAQECSKVLLAVAVPGDAGKSGGGSQEPAASLTLYDIAPNCVPAGAEKNKKKMDQVLGALTSEGTTILGMMPIEQPMGYLIQGLRVHLAAVQGQPVTKTDLQTSESQLRAAVAVAVRGHILSWMLEANSVEGFNRLLASRVDFGAGQPQALAPMQFH